MDKSIWKEAVRKNIYKKIVGSHNRCEEEVYAMKREGISFVERRKGGGERVCEGAVEERIYLTIQITTNSTSILCGEEGWKEEDGTGLPVFK